MSTPIPEDVMVSAMRALMVNQPEMVESVARALMAEREACAEEADKYAYASGIAKRIASAIRDRSKT